VASTERLYSLDRDKNGTRQGAEASNVVPFKHPNGLVVKGRPKPWPGPRPKLVLDSAKLVRPLPKVQQALSTFPKGPSVSREKFIRQKLRLPYGRWITEDGTEVLYNRKYQPLFVWRAGTDKPERCDPHWIDGIVDEGWFYSDASANVIDRSKLYHALETLLDAWERGDRAAADVLEEWLLSKHLTYLELTQAYQEAIAQRRAEFALVEDLMNNPA
jgi:hypothetical protein